MLGKGSTFVFKEPDQLQCTPFDPSKYEEYLNVDETSDDMLRQYIMKEADNFREAMLVDLGELRREYQALGTQVSDARQKNEELAQTARNIQAKYDEANRQLRTLETRFDQEKEAKTVASEQLSDIKKMIKGMTEAKAKFLKACNKDSLNKVKKIISAGQSRAVGTGRDILDGITKFVMKNTGATFANDGQQIFATPETFSKAIKDCMPTDMDRSWLQTLAQSVNQSGNADGLTKGPLLKAVSDDSIGADAVPFFPYFKILFKLAQLGMTITKRTSLERTVEKTTKAMEESQIDMEKQKAIVGNLEFYKRIEAEVNRANE